MKGKKPTNPDLLYLSKQLEQLTAEVKDLKRQQKPAGLTGKIKIFVGIVGAVLGINRAIAFLME